ncbi:MAG: PIN domain-containing protein, partial [Candidatus Aenigmarchaeota archaeon]|nr:PIN domain-containing protein [Candidatus Aenigmarchaeota archaeon]MDI6722779.1 PIN domain-containing protein [Candidatus Aenigmarchaeota archaeon]
IITGESYLDSDILLAIVKESDWLKPKVDLRKINNPKTSVFTIIEAEIVLLREYSRKDAIEVLEKASEKGIKTVDFTNHVMKKSNEFLSRYDKLNIFDSVHAAFSFVLKEEILSTDTIFDEIKEIKRIDPRSI